ncbi:MAG: hypothetical protein ACR2K2_05925 [Mycobacteriales bacterium]
MTHPRPQQPRPLRKLISWVVVIPVVSLVLAVLGNLALIFAAVLAFCAVGAIRYQLGELERGFVWGTLALVSAMAVAGSSPFLAYSYVALRGERVDAVVVEELPRSEVRIADPVTNEDLGTRGGRGPDRSSTARSPVGPYYYKVGDTVPVLVASRFGLEALPLNNVDLSVNFAKAWVGGWLLGLGLTVVSTVQQGRRV